MPSLESGDHEKPPKSNEEAKGCSKEKQSSSSETLPQFIRRILTELIDSAVLGEDGRKKIQASSSPTILEMKREELENTTR